MASNATVELPDPNGEGEIVYTEVIKDIEERAEKGKGIYGTYLRTFDGRPILVDLYQELIDAVMYTKKELMERESDES